MIETECPEEPSKKTRSVLAAKIFCKVVRYAIGNPDPVRNFLIVQCR